MRPATLIIASDEFLASEALDELRAAAIAESFGIEEIPADDAQGLMYAISTPSLFGDGRFVLVREAESLPVDSHDGLASWIADPPPGIALALVASGVGATKLAKLFPTAGVIKTEGVPPWKSAEWVIGRVRSKSRRITGEGAAALVEAVGTELRDLAAAVDRLIETTQGQIDVTEVASQYHGVESQVYQFVDAVFDRDRPTAHKRLRALVDAGENRLGLLAALARQLRIVATVAGGDRRPPAVIAKELGLRSEGAVKRALRQSRGFGPEDIRRAYRLLADADLALKSEEDDALVLELVVDEIAER